jgi:hypothetical protein
MANMIMKNVTYFISKNNQTISLAKTVVMKFQMIYKNDGVQVESAQLSAIKLDKIDEGTCHA